MWTCRGTDNRDMGTERGGSYDKGRQKETKYVEEGEVTTNRVRWREERMM
jgi:hypothetical protein